MDLAAGMAKLLPGTKWSNSSSYAMLKAGYDSHPENTEPLPDEATLLAAGQALHNEQIAADARVAEIAVKMKSGIASGPEVQELLVAKLGL